jgi:hypothetical protein
MIGIIAPQAFTKIEKTKERKNCIRRRVLFCGIFNPKIISF